MTWHLHLAESPELEDQLTEHLVAHNQAASDAVRRRFEPGNLASRPVQAYAVDEAGTLLAGCTGRTEDVWQWLTVDTMWVDPAHRGQGLGLQVLSAVEDQARQRGCRWSKLNTWEFQAPGFYERHGYREIFRWEGVPVASEADVHLRKEL